ncbi:MAG: NCS2 family permease [bacterium]
MNSLEKYFGFGERKTNLKTEITAGVTTFMTMAYIIFVNPAILSAGGVPFRAAVVATCIASGLFCIVMGLYTNYPFTLAPGMGINAIVAWTIVLTMKQPWQTAMGIIFIEGLIVTILVLTNLREMVMNAIPKSLKLAIGVGIGIFIALIGLEEGGIITGNPVTLVQLGDFNKNYVQLTMAGILITSVLLVLKIRGAILIGIIITAVCAFFFGIVSFPDALISPPRAEDFDTFFQMDVKSALNLSLVPMIFALFMTDFFDTMGTVIAVGRQAELLDEKGSLPGLKKVLLVDSLAAVFGGLFGCSSVTSYIESAAGVSEGGRTGLTSIVTGILFFISIIFLPLVKLIGGGFEISPGVFKYPITAPALIIVGFLMIELLKDIDWSKIDEGLPAFFIILLIPFTYNISYGIGFGFISYSLIKLFTGRPKEVHPVLYVISILFVLAFIIPH